jgi:hypothetical protein
MKTVSDLFARVQAGENFGPEVCHWCGSPCTRTIVHDDPYPIPFQKRTTFAKCRNSIYVCTGCWSYRWKKVTVKYLTGGWKDGSTLSAHSWLMTRQGVWALKTVEVQLESIYTWLLAPPPEFSLSLLENAKENMIQAASLNFLSEVKGDTPLKVTVDNSEQTYTVYDLEYALKEGTAPTPGVASLLRVIGNWNGMKREEGWRPVGVTDLGGRPTATEDLRKKDVTGNGNVPGQQKKRRAG